mmetsp:Transcript_4076/g.7513  ORF Transcript_4076/g.7513 Transcript_4076/m.7513 type:complete len:300 (+) Transcript_4076:100-999(+)|eukprot:CAMPEP_0197536902 /NCGR_PEP_ID=MMETSP1318-20131121/55286_1 /TAXON_ID=552666 /ORGANISM="Partenskyella glossopodia, Strain RCC365" /LENGTH=299 /DNA_ID=CAMNT_0043094923 /DNA_START=40 /DNA_END=939 /DNA_ORIENTATION=-
MALPHIWDLGTNVFLLGLIVVFHVTFLFVEIAAFRMSSSLSLLSDALHSGLDIGTFLVNLWAEYKISRAQRMVEYFDLGDGKADPASISQEVRKAQDSADWWEAVASIGTGVALLLSTLYVLYEAVERILDNQPNEEINDTILLWTVVIMVVFNGGILLAFWWTSGFRGIMHAHSHSHGGCACRSGAEVNNNMFSAILHIMADQVQNVALLVVALLVKFRVGDPIIVDAVGSILTGLGTTVLAWMIIRASMRKTLVGDSRRSSATANKFNQNGHQNGHTHQNGHSRMDSSTPLKIAVHS